MRNSTRFAVLALALSSAAAVWAREATWLDKVAPIISSAEKKTYLAASEAERTRFEENFWSSKSITGEEYFHRQSYIDSTFGSGKPGSGANTDPGRVYLTIGPPTKVARHPASRIFVPLEIWYYDRVPGVIDTEVRLIFYQKNSVGYLRLYSPGLDTVRALLLPEAATVHAFGPNDSATEADMRNILRVPPSEDEIISAAANIATGVKYTGNEEILARISSPADLLAKPPAIAVTSRLLPARGRLEVFRTVSPYAGSQVDLRLEASAAREIKVEIVAAGLPVYKNAVHLNFRAAQPVVYTHRLDLLPGSYHAVFTIDGTASTWPIDISAAQSMSDIIRADIADSRDSRQTPFRFEAKQLDLNPQGAYAAVALSQPGKVTWMIRKGSAVVWRGTSDPGGIPSIAVPANLPPGIYRLEAVTAGDSRSIELRMGGAADSQPDSTQISFNANLAPATRLAFLGHQWLLQGDIAKARETLSHSLAEGVTDDAEIELARIEAITGNPDSARQRVRDVLAHDPGNFQALSVYAYVEASLQDYVVAGELYRRALSIEDSPVIRMALARLPRN